MTKKNIEYKTDQISDFFSINRQKWDDFYPSEKWMFDRIAGASGNFGQVLDVGCAAGGLGSALAERFSLERYTGIDINAQAIEVAKARTKMKPVKSFQFIHGDILDITTLPIEGFDNVFSLSCADWNISTNEIIGDCWKYVRQGGNFVLTLRLSAKPSLLDFSESFQFIYHGDSLPDNIDGIEKAPYVVFNIKDALSLLSNLRPAPVGITAYGYWGAPSATARTKYDRLVFAAIAVKKGTAQEQCAEIKGDLHLPIGLFL